MRSGTATSAEPEPQKDLQGDTDFVAALISGWYPLGV